MDLSLMLLLQFLSLHPSQQYPHSERLDAKASYNTEETIMAVEIKAPDEFSEEEVLQFLRGLDLSDHIGSFQSEAVDGSLLVTLTFDELTDELGLSMGEARKVLQMVDFCSSLSSNGQTTPGATTLTVNSDPRIQTLQSENEALRIRIAKMERDIRELRGETPVSSSLQSTYSPPAATADSGSGVCTRGSAYVLPVTPIAISNSAPQYVSPNTATYPPPASTQGMSYQTQQTTSMPSYVSSTSDAATKTKTTPTTPSYVQPYIQSQPTTTTEISHTAPSTASYTPYISAVPPQSSSLNSRTPRNVYVPQETGQSTMAPYVLPSPQILPDTSNVGYYRSYQPKVYVPYQTNNTTNKTDNSLTGQLARYV